jgi:hypothetical protein
MSMFFAYSAYSAYSFLASVELISLLFCSFSFAYIPEMAMINWTVREAGECDHGWGVVPISYKENA